MQFKKVIFGIVMVFGFGLHTSVSKAYAYADILCGEVCEDPQGCACQCGSRNDPTFSMQVGDICEDAGGARPADDPPLCQSNGDCNGGYCTAASVCENGGTGAPCDESDQCANGYCYASGTCD